MAGITIDLDGLEDELGKEASELVFDIANEFVNQLIIEAPMGATGDLQDSFKIFRRTDNTIYLGSRLHYAMDVYTGTEPHLANFEDIQVWARRKLGDESLAGPVWRGIAQHGTRENPYLDRAMDNTLERFS